MCYNILLYIGVGNLMNKQITVTKNELFFIYNKPYFPKVFLFYNFKSRNLVLFIVNNLYFMFLFLEDYMLNKNHNELYNSYVQFKI